MAASRYFAFTLSNYSDEQERIIQNYAMENSNVMHLFYGHEKAPTTGTPHLQGCLCLRKKCRPTTIKNLLNIEELHIEPCKKVYEANLNYCDFFKEFNLFIHGKTGTEKSFRIYEIVYVLNEFWKLYCKLRDREHKSLRVYKKSRNKWWDDYMGQEIVVIEELVKIQFDNYELNKKQKIIQECFSESQIEEIQSNVLEFNNNATEEPESEESATSPVQPEEEEINEDEKEELLIKASFTEEEQQNYFEEWYENTNYEDQNDPTIKDLRDKYPTFDYLKQILKNKYRLNNLNTNID
ncbi:hypothetical protein LY90DRAFT_507378 [Neocallimastix californiae]|uniref:CRESS-DNA virus Rep endonuclease domain-containing protein n=1 Tax=Neocallimastix californiae TaxID=1754190 RepID=A0A1Y2D679_9FUNG|nr:hypothetical protein LY90DRAFT_507378 [Neocallimastix californiae]|eukprot:ORY54770.1 hypothetical protein LY90DRAFT_507378 [Neocallimastix californiae]